MKKIIFGTLNMNGGGASHNRQVQVKSLFDRKQIEVLLLWQETLITEDVEYDWCRLFKGQCFFSNLASSSAGVAFLFRPGLVPESCHFQEVIKGRFISLELVIDQFSMIVFAWGVILIVPSTCFRQKYSRTSPRILCRFI